MVYRGSRELGCNCLQNIMKKTGLLHFEVHTSTLFMRLNIVIE